MLNLVRSVLVFLIFLVLSGAAGAVVRLKPACMHRQRVKDRTVIRAAGDEFVVSDDELRAFGDKFIVIEKIQDGQAGAKK